MQRQTSAMSEGGEKNNDFLTNFYKGPSINNNQNNLNSLSALNSANYPPNNINNNTMYNNVTNYLSVVV